MTFDPEGLLRSFEARAREQAEQAQQLSQRMQKATSTVESSGGEVRLTVDSTGGLADLEFGAPAERVSLQRLAQLVLEASRQAQRRMAAQMSTVVAQMYGADSPTSQFVSSAYAERFAAHPEYDREDRR